MEPKYFMDDFYIDLANNIYHDRMKIGDTQYNGAEVIDFIEKIHERAEAQGKPFYKNLYRGMMEHNFAKLPVFEGFRDEVCSYCKNKIEELGTPAQQPTTATGEDPGQTEEALKVAQDISTPKMSYRAVCLLYFYLEQIDHQKKITATNATSIVKRYKLNSPKKLENMKKDMAEQNYLPVNSHHSRYAYIDTYQIIIPILEKEYPAQTTIIERAKQALQSMKKA